jgi:hypothetical protein
MRIINISHLLKQKIQFCFKLCEHFPEKNDPQKRQTPFHKGLPQIRIIIYSNYKADALGDIVQKNLHWRVSNDQQD